MIKIIKQGQELKPQIFECPNCDCVFEADNQNYGLENQSGDIFYRCPCPHCLHYVYKPWEDSQEND